MLIYMYVVGLYVYSRYVCMYVYVNIEGFYVPLQLSVVRLDVDIRI